MLNQLTVGTRLLLVVLFTVLALAWLAGAVILVLTIDEVPILDGAGDGAGPILWIVSLAVALGPPWVLGTWVEHILGFADVEVTEAVAG